MSKIRILIADDHSIVRSGLSAVLNLDAGMEVVGEAANGQRAVRLAAELKPDVIIMDLMMPVLNGAEATVEILKANPQAHILILTTYGSAAEIAHVLDAGALGILLKSASNTEIKAAIRHVAVGKRHIDPEVEALRTETQAPRLSTRDKEFLTSVARGLTNQDIARQFALSPSGVKKNLSIIFEKLGVATRAEAVATAIRQKLLNL